MLEKILTWSSRCSDHGDKLRLSQLKHYDLLISQARQPLLIHKPVIRPLLRLLSACAEHSNKVRADSAAIGRATRKVRDD